MKETKKKAGIGLLLFCSVILCNPNVNVLDVFPDFIAYFILSRLLTEAADSAPYFEECRTMLFRLAWVNLLKFPALIMITAVRRINSLDNDIYALTSFTFAVIETLMLIFVIKYLFSAIFYLAERTDTSPILEPFSLKIADKELLMRPEELRSFLYVFVTVKAALSTIPDFFLLTKTTDSGRLSISKLYPYILILSIVLGILLAVAFFRITKRYIKKISEECSLNAALISIRRSGTNTAYESKTKIRALSTPLTFFSIAAFLSLDMIFDNFDYINIFPRFIFGFFFMLALFMLSRREKKPSYTIPVCVLYILSSAVSFAFSVRFLSEYTYNDLLRDYVAKKEYLYYEIASVIEFALLIAMMICASEVLKSFILKNTGLSPDSERYNKMERDYHKSLIRKSNTMLILSVTAGFAKLLNVFFTGKAQLIFTDPNDITQPTFVASSIPWFNLVVFALSAFYIGYTLYFISTLKDEIKIKYQII